MTVLAQLINLQRNFNSQYIRVFMPDVFPRFFHRALSIDCLLSFRQHFFCYDVQSIKLHSYFFSDNLFLSKNS